MKKIKNSSNNWILYLFIFVLVSPIVSVIIFTAALYFGFWLVNTKLWYPFAQRTYPQTSECSWFKHVPPGWQCTDNWGNPHRIISVQKDNSALVLDINTTLKPLLTCDTSTPLSFYIKPSPSGLTLPSVCRVGDQVYYQAVWEQDGWDFQLIGKNVDRGLFLMNLNEVGE